MRPLPALLLWLTLTTLGACASPSPLHSPAASPTPAPAASTAASANGLPSIDRSCRSDADCTVKNVGNCCGAAPACVNIASATDPQAVKAQCQDSGRMSVCGFRQISGCQCVSGQCSANAAATDTLPRPANATQPLR